MGRPVIELKQVETQRFSGFFYQKAQALNPTIYLNFETFFHPHVSEFIRGLNRKGISGLLNLANQTLGNPYLHSPWKENPHAISYTVSGGACLIEGGFNLSYMHDPVNGRPGDFEAVVLEGSELWHYRHDNSDVTKPWEKLTRI